MKQPRESVVSLSSFLARVVRLGLLVPVAVLWWWLCTQVPYEWKEIGYIAAIDSQRFSSQISRNNYTSCRVFDIAKRTVTPVDHWVRGIKQPASGVSLVSQMVKTESGDVLNRLEMKLYDHQLQDYVRTLEHTFPIGCYPRLIGGRYIVALARTEIVWLDLKAQGEQWSILPVPSAAVDSEDLKGSDQYPNFVKHYIKPVPATSPAPPQTIAECYRFDEQGQLLLLASLPTVGKEWPHVAFADDTLLSINSAATHIDYRSLVDGQVFKSIPLAEPMDVTQESFSLSNESLTVWKGPATRYYSIATGRVIKNPYPTPSGNTRSFQCLSPNKQLAVTWIWGTSQATVANAETDEVVCNIEDGGSVYRFLDDRTLISLDTSSDLTIRQYDLATGQPIMTWRPFWWTWPWLALATLATVCWIWMWLHSSIAQPKESRLSNHPLSQPLLAWVDLNIVLCLIMTLIVCRLVSTGDAADVSRPIYGHASYMSIGYLAVAWCWLVLSSEPIVNRLAVLLSIYAIILGALAWTMSQQLAQAWTGIALISTPGLLLVPLAAIARFRGFKLQAEQVAGTAKDRVTRMTVGQIMAVTVVFAILFMAARPMWPGIRGILAPAWELWRLLAASLACGLGLVVGFGSYRWLASGGVTLSALMLGLVIGEPFLRDSLWQMQVYQNWYWAIDFVLNCGGMFAVTTIVSSVARAGSTQNHASVVFCP